eukprot:11216658-Lingulodinium_polyedra.AAC.1
MAPAARSPSLTSAGRCSVAGALPQPNAQTRPVATTVAQNLRVARSRRRSLDAGRRGARFGRVAGRERP